MFELPKLPYAKDALEPHMSAQTLEFHHGKHHAKYVEVANDLIKGTDKEGQSLESLIVSSFGKDAKLFNNAGQIFNHNEFWKCMSPNGGGAIPAALEAKIVEAFGSVDAFKEKFVAEGGAQFGSGWVWLVLKDGKLEIMKTANAESPLVHGATPLLVADVWEHAYYLDYQNRRPDFLKTFIEKLVNWDYVAENLAKA
ncbi:superoxide dismutase [Iodidimonas gelatinilytica]|uniref:Superoxide dismutase n=2 Tax=Iodidimonas TaxID=2066486 RepID=A0A5A7MKM3_9PROT|nr:MULTISPECIES: superoxide dismutase [Iodidimonas]GEQ96551.1 superoxide dismutase [Iodidimonas gelatinilytica]GER06581.1 superoxide dismutase [Kordiimonadales bacterium JCM 17843]GGO05357.1 superoxide dismutase [Iodidimonas muriae]